MFKKTIIIGFLCLFFSIIALANSQTAFSFKILSYLHYLPVGDKAMHFLLVGTLGVVANLHFDWKKVAFWGRRVFLGSLITLVFITLEECSQLFIPNRNFELLDLASNYLGIWCLTKLVVLVSKRYFKNRIGVSSNA